MKKTGGKGACLRAVILCFLLIGVIASAVVPSVRKATLYQANDISDYSALSHVPNIAILSNHNDTELTFHLEEKELYAVCLYFRVVGNDGENPETDGRVIAELSKDGQVLGTKSVSVLELYHRSKTSSLTIFKEKEFVFDLEGKQKGEFTLKLRGENIPDKTRVSLLGGMYVPEYITLKGQLNRLNGVLCVIETKQLKHPYTWYMMLLLSLYLLAIAVWHSGREREGYR